MDDRTKYQRFVSDGAGPEEVDRQARGDGASGATRYWLLRNLCQLSIPATRAIMRLNNEADPAAEAAPAWRRTLETLAW
ncbi:MAG TPA: hypothetical protein VGE07_22380 [Herpetosiphonaceae bacterium]